jgi:hypothetical protein
VEGEGRVLEGKKLPIGSFGLSEKSRLGYRLRIGGSYEDKNLFNFGVELSRVKLSFGIGPDNAFTHWES